MTRESHMNTLNTQDSFWDFVAIVRLERIGDLKLIRKCIQGVTRYLLIFLLNDNNRRNVHLYQMSYVFVRNVPKV